MRRSTFATLAPFVAFAAFLILTVGDFILKIDFPPMSLGQRVMFLMTAVFFYSLGFIHGGKE